MGILTVNELISNNWRMLQNLNQLESLPNQEACVSSKESSFDGSWRSAMIRVEKKNVTAMSKTTQFTAAIAKTCRHIALWLFYLLTVPCGATETEQTRETQSVVSYFCQYVHFTPKKKLKCPSSHLSAVRSIMIVRNIVTTYETARCHNPENQS